MTISCLVGFKVVMNVKWVVKVAQPLAAVVFECNPI